MESIIEFSEPFTVDMQVPCVAFTLTTLMGGAKFTGVVRVQLGLAVKANSNSQ
jgi:hypothetical protein